MEVYRMKLVLAFLHLSLDHGVDLVRMKMEVRFPKKKLGYKCNIKKHHLKLHEIKLLVCMVHITLHFNSEKRLKHNLK